MLGKLCRADLMVLVNAYCKKTGVTLEQAGFALYGNRKFFLQFAAWERSVTIDKFDEMINRLASSWPKDLNIPQLRLIAFPPRTGGGGKKI